jgi:exosome complex component RRP46
MCILFDYLVVSGSSRFNFDKTSVYVGVFGPTEAKSYQRLSDESILVVNYALPTGQTFHRETESIVRRTLEPLIVRSQNPMCAIEVSVQVVNDDGGLLSASINAAVSALVDAGVPMRGQAAAVTCAIVADGSIMLDPTRAEEAAAEACITFVMDGSGGILTSVCSGAFLVGDSTVHTPVIPWQRLEP